MRARTTINQLYGCGLCRKWAFPVSVGMLSLMTVVVGVVGAIARRGQHDVSGLCMDDEVIYVNGGMVSSMTPLPAPQGSRPSQCPLSGGKFVMR